MVGDGIILCIFFRKKKVKLTRVWLKSCWYINIIVISSIFLSPLKSKKKLTQISRFEQKTQWGHRRRFSFLSELSSSPAPAMSDLTPPTTVTRKETPFLSTPTRSAHFTIQGNFYPRFELQIWDCDRWLHIRFDLLNLLLLNWVMRHWIFWVQYKMCYVKKSIEWKRKLHLECFRFVMDLS